MIKKTVVVELSSGLEARPIAMLVQVASAAAQMPHRNTNRNKNSSPALRADIIMFKAMLLRTRPQIFR